MEKTARKEEKENITTIPTHYRVIELHVNTYRIERRNGFLTLTVSRGNGVYLKFLVMESDLLPTLKGEVSWS